MNRVKQLAKYLLSDYIAGSLSWFIMFYVRYYVIDYGGGDFNEIASITIPQSVWYTIFILPVCWIFLYALSGYYIEIYRKSKIAEISQTFNSVLIGTIIVFFVLILDDYVISYKNYYKSFLALFVIQFSLTLIPRMIITVATTRKIQSGKIIFKTIIIGSGNKALKLLKALSGKSNTAGGIFGYISVSGKQTENKLQKHLTFLGEFNDIIKIIETNSIKEVIIAINKGKQADIEKIISELQQTNVTIKIIPSLYNLLTSQEKLTNILGVSLITISNVNMPGVQSFLKRVIDIFLSLFALIIGIPAFIFAAAGVKLTSKGSVIFKQERIGRNRKPFTIYKFRSMYLDAEATGPQLSSANDPRITSFGRFMRKTRLDEIPQFYNVLIGDMSIVGPRPERQFYIDQIIKEAPHYVRLFNVRPGITSLGAVKYGYTENVEQMIEQLNYDIMYVENMSLFFDLKILIYTVFTVLKRTGK